MKKKKQNSATPVTRRAALRSLLLTADTQLRTSVTHRAVAVQDQRLDQLFAVGRFRRDTQGGESQQSRNQLCSHGLRQRAAREHHQCQGSCSQGPGEVFCNSGLGHTHTYAHTHTHAHAHTHTHTHTASFSRGLCPI